MILCILKGEMPFKMHKIIFFPGYVCLPCLKFSEMPFNMHKIVFFPENLKKNIGFNSTFKKGRVTLNAGIFLFGLTSDIFYHLLMLNKCMLKDGVYN